MRVTMESQAAGAQRLCELQARAHRQRAGFAFRRACTSTSQIQNEGQKGFGRVMQERTMQGASVPFRHRPSQQCVHQCSRMAQRASVCRVHLATHTMTTFGRSIAVRALCTTPKVGCWHCSCGTAYTNYVAAPCHASSVAHVARACAGSMQLNVGIQRQLTSCAKHMPCSLNTLHCLPYALRRACGMWLQSSHDNAQASSRWGSAISQRRDMRVGIQLGGALLC